MHSLTITQLLKYSNKKFIILKNLVFYLAWLFSQLWKLNIWNERKLMIKWIRA